MSILDIDANLFFLPPTRRGVRGHPYKVLQGTSHRRRRGSAFSVRIMQYWNKIPASVVTAPSVNVFKKRLEKVWAEVFPHFPHCLNTHPLNTSLRGINQINNCTIITGNQGPGLSLAFINYSAINQSSFQSYTVDKCAVVIRLSNKGSIKSMTQQEFDDFDSTELRKAKALYEKIDCSYRVKKL